MLCLKPRSSLLTALRIKARGLLNSIASHHRLSLCIVSVASHIIRLQTESTSMIIPLRSLMKLTGCLCAGCPGGMIFLRGFPCHQRQSTRKEHALRIPDAVRDHLQRGVDMGAPAPKPTVTRCNMCQCDRFRLPTQPYCRLFPAVDDD
jgi:hypothetical protein